MTLTTKEKSLVTTTFYKIMPISDTTAAHFYERLFEIAPDIAPMFSDTNMTALRKKLMDMLALVIHALDDFDKVKKAMHNLGERHIRYGVASEQYAPVGEALLWAFAAALGDGWTEDVEAAWQKTYQILTDMATNNLSES